LRFLGGGLAMGDRDRFAVECIQPGQECDMMVTLISPSLPGQYQGQWRLATPTGVFFGDIIWIVIQVEEGGIMGVTQAMRHLSYDAMSEAHYSTSLNIDSTSPSPGWSCSSSSDSKLEEMSPVDVSSLSGAEYRGAERNCRQNPFHFPSSPPRRRRKISDEFDVTSPQRIDEFSANSPSNISVEDTSPPRPISPEHSPHPHRLSNSPIFASFSPPSISPRSSTCPGNPLPPPASSSLAPPLVLPPSPPPFVSSEPAVGGFFVTPTISQERGQENNSPTVSMTDDDEDL